MRTLDPRYNIYLMVGCLVFGLIWLLLVSLVACDWLGDKLQRGGAWNVLALVVILGYGALVFAVDSVFDLDGIEEMEWEKPWDSVCLVVGVLGLIWVIFAVVSSLDWLGDNVHRGVVAKGGFFAFTLLGGALWGGYHGCLIFYSARSLNKSLPDQENFRESENGDAMPKEEIVTEKRREEAINKQEERKAPVQVDLGDINHDSAKEAAQGRWKARKYQKTKVREGENIRTEIEADKVATEAAKVKTERAKATKELLRETGHTTGLPEKERREVELELLRLDTEELKILAEQEKIRKQIRELGRNDPPQPEAREMSEEEKYNKAMNEELRRLKHQLAVQAAKEMLTLERMTERAQFVIEWQQRMYEQYPDIADQIIDAFERVQVESDMG